MPTKKKSTGKTEKTKKKPSVLPMTARQKRHIRDANYEKRMTIIAKETMEADLEAAKAEETVAKERRQAAIKDLKLQKQISMTTEQLRREQAQAKIKEKKQMLATQRANKRLNEQLRANVEQAKLQEKEQAIKIAEKKKVHDWLLEKAILRKREEFKEQLRQERLAKREAGRGGNHIGPGGRLQSSVSATGAFGGFAFGAKYGMLTYLSGKGVLGKTAGAFLIAADILGHMYMFLIKLTTKFTLVAGGAATMLGRWISESVSFNQQANKMVEALVSNNERIAESTGNYLRRTLARQLPFTTRETLTAAPQFWSLGKKFEEGNFLTQLMSDMAFGLNPGNPGRAAMLANKALQDVIAAGKIRGEEIRQLSNVGIPRGLLYKNMLRLWNSEEFQTKNKGIGKVANVSELLTKQKAGIIPSNLAINAIAATVLQRLRRHKIGEYSQWATTHTTAGLESQVKSLPMEIIDLITKKGNGKAVPAYMEMLFNFVEKFGSLRFENQTAVMLDNAISSFLEFPKAFIEAFNGFGFIQNLTEGVQAVNWTKYGQFAADAVSWLGEAFKGFMEALELLRPMLQTVVLGGLKSIFGKTHTEIAESIKNFSIMFIRLAALGRLLISVANQVAFSPLGAIVAKMYGVDTIGINKKQKNDHVISTRPKVKVAPYSRFGGIDDPATAWRLSPPAAYMQFDGLPAPVIYNQTIEYKEGQPIQFANKISSEMIWQIMKEAIF